jgi:hypothetical protein
MSESEPLPTNIYRGIALLGWMSRDEAVRFLTKDCWTASGWRDGQAEALWQVFRDRAAALPEREAPAPRELSLSEDEREHVGRFLPHLRKLGISDVEIIKIDPMQLVVAQFHITVDLAARYLDRCKTATGWMSLSMPISSVNPDLSASLTRNNLDTNILIELPHAEFTFGIHPQGGFGPKELRRHVAVLRVGDRMLLSKGYHRLYARVSGAEGRLPERLSLVVLESGMLAPAERGMHASPVTDAGLNVFGVRPALFADFFTEGLALPVYLLRKRYQLHVSARWVSIDDP